MTVLINDGLGLITLEVDGDIDFERFASSIFNDKNVLTVFSVDSLGNVTHWSRQTKIVDLSRPVFEHNKNCVVAIVQLGNSCTYLLNIGGCWCQYNWVVSDMRSNFNEMVFFRDRYIYFDSSEVLDFVKNNLI